MRMASVLIAGAGPTGLTLACDLCSRGIDAQVVDKAAGPATTSRALGLQPRDREILDRLGALGDLPDRAVHAAATSILLGQRADSMRIPNWRARSPATAAPKTSCAAALSI